MNVNSLSHQKHKYKKKHGEYDVMVKNYQKIQEKCEEMA